MGIVQRGLVIRDDDFDTGVIRQNNWGYQDFPAGTITGTEVTITANENGTGFSFQSSKVITNSAAIVLTENSSKKPYTGSSKLFSKIVNVDGNTGVNITLSGVPDVSWGSIRIYYLYVYDNGLPLDFTPVPSGALVNHALLDELNANFVTEEELSKITPNIQYPVYFTNTNAGGFPIRKQAVFTDPGALNPSINAGLPDGSYTLYEAVTVGAFNALNRVRAGTHSAKLNIDRSGTATVTMTTQMFLLRSGTTTLIAEDATGVNIPIGSSLIPAYLTSDQDLDLISGDEIVFKFSFAFVGSSGEVITINLAGDSGSIAGILTESRVHWVKDQNNIKPAVPGDSLDMGDGSVGTAYVDLSNDESAPVYEEGRVFYDTDAKALSHYNEVAGVAPIRMGRTLRSRIYNGETFTIQKGDVVKISGLMGTSPVVKLAQANTIADARETLGMVMNDIAAGAVGYAAVFDTVIGVDTSAAQVNDVIYLDADNPGKFTFVEPEPPNYVLPVGFVSVVDAVNGVVGVRFAGYTGSDTSTNLGGSLNGIVTQTPEVNFVVDGGVIYADVKNKNEPTKNLPFIIDGVRYLLNTTTGSGVGGAARTIVNAGASSTQLAETIVYVYLNGGVPTLGSASGEPSLAFAPIAFVAAFDAARTLADGKPLVYRRYNNAVDYLNGVNDGSLGIITEMLTAFRTKLGSNWLSGQDATPDVSNTSIRVSLTSGRGQQFRRFNTPSFDGTSYLIFNDITNTATYQQSNNLTDIITDASGGTLLTNNTFYKIRLFYLLNSNGIGNEVIATRPLGSYNTAIEALQDPNSYAVKFNDSSAETTVYALYDLVIGRTGAGGTTITLEEIVNRRTRIPFGAGGGASGGGVTSFLGLSDTPGTYVGQALSLLQVNAGETALEYTKSPTLQDITTTGDVVIGGDLTVNGTTTTINTETLDVKDKNIEMGVVTAPTDVTANGGGWTLRGTTDKTIVWDNINENWTSSEHFNLASGKQFKINNVEYLATKTTSDLTEGANLYYTEARVSANTDVAANTVHRGSTTNPHSVTLLQLGVSATANSINTIDDGTSGEMVYSGGTSGLLYDNKFKRTSSGTTTRFNFESQDGSFGLTFGVQDAGALNGESFIYSTASDLVFGAQNTETLRLNITASVFKSDLRFDKTAPVVQLLAANSNKSKLQLYESGNFGYELEYDGALDEMNIWSRGFAGNEAVRMKFQKNGDVTIPKKLILNNDSNGSLEFTGADLVGGAGDGFVRVNIKGVERILYAYTP